MGGGSLPLAPDSSSLTLLRGLPLPPLLKQNPVRDSSCFSWLVSLMVTTKSTKDAKFGVPNQFICQFSSIASTLAPAVIRRSIQAILFRVISSFSWFQKLAVRKNHQFSRNLAAETGVNTIARQPGNRRVPPLRLNPRSPIQLLVEAHVGLFGSQSFTWEEVV